MDSKIVIDIDKIRQGSAEPVYLNPVADAICSFEDGCSAKAAKYKGHNVMVISGSITEDDVIEIFNEQLGIFVEPMIITPEWDDEFADTLTENKKAGEKGKKKDKCCPPKKKGIFEGKWISLKSAMAGETGNKKNASKYSVNEVIDILAGNKLNESVADRAIRKAALAAKENKKSNTRKEKDKVLENLGSSLYRRIVENLEAGKECLHGDVKINGKCIKECGIDELRGYKDKADEAVANFNKEIASVNESEKLNTLREKLSKMQRFQTVLEEEIAYREARAGKLTEDESSDDIADTSAVEFKNINPNEESDNTESDDKGDGEGDDTEEGDGSEEENPDKDEIVELGKVAIQIEDEETANTLRDELINAGVPEDVIEITPIEDESEDDNNEEEENQESEEGTEEGGEQASDVGDDTLDNLFDEGNEGQAAESVAVDNKAGRLTEDEGEEGDADATEGGDEGDAADSGDAGGEEGDEGSDKDAPTGYLLTLTDTDYVETMKDVLIDRWGVTEDEFTEMIGGDIVSGDEEESSDEGEEQSGDDTEGDSGEGEEGGEQSNPEEEDDDLDFDPEDIFKNL